MYPSFLWLEGKAKRQGIQSKMTIKIKIKIKIKINCQRIYIE
jgi:hypothetical protein